MMSMSWRRTIAVLLAGLVVVMAVGCSYFAADDDVYRNSRSLDYLKPPQGVDIPRSNDIYRVPDAGKAASAGSSIASKKPPSGDGATDVSAPVAAANTKQLAEPATTRPAPSPVATLPSASTASPVSTPDKPETTGPFPVFVTRQTLTDPMVVKQPSNTVPPTRVKKKRQAVTTRNWFEVDATPEKVWARLVSYWMDRGFPLIESNPVKGRILTDWVPSVDEAARARGTRDQFEVLLERSRAGSKVTLKHRASRKTAVNGERPEWTLLGSDPVIQGVETARLRDYLTGQ